MTETFNSYPIKKVDHSKFGGIIYLSDFNTDHRGRENRNGSSIASRIEADRRWEEKTLKNRDWDKQ